MRRGFALVERINHDPHSRWRARTLGSEDHIGWTNEVYMLANLLDAINNLTKAAAQRKAKLKKSERAVRPEVRRVAEVRPTSVRDTDFGVLMNHEG